MAKGLTKRQDSILQFILDYVQEEGYPPSIREIGAHFKIGSLRGVTVHLDALDRKGYISRSNTPRSIKVVHPSRQATNSMTMLPLMGSISASAPGGQVQEGHAETTLPVPSYMVAKAPGAFLLRIEGESMAGEGILPDDLVVVKPQETATNGELVAARMLDGFTVKRYSKGKDGVVRLMPSNPDTARFQPIPVLEEDARVIGRVVGLIRDYS